LVISQKTPGNLRNLTDSLIVEHYRSRCVQGRWSWESWRYLHSCCCTRDRLSAWLWSARPHGWRNIGGWSSIPVPIVPRICANRESIRRTPSKPSY